MNRPLLLDLDSGAGGIAKGYHDAGFDVIGVDIVDQPHYPYEFVRADAIAVLSRLISDGEPWPGAPWFDAVHVSPPCQDHMETPHSKHGTGWMLPASRYYLKQQARPWVIENVPGADMRADYVLCGCMFGLRLPDGRGQLVRKRLFETSWGGFEMREPCHHTAPAISVVGHGSPTWVRSKLGRNPTIAEYRALMGIDWMNRDELSQAIPPQYGEYIGKQLLAALAEAA